MQNQFLKKKLNSSPYFVVVKSKQDTGKNLKYSFIKHAKKLGKICPQNKNKDQILEIKANLKKIDLLKKERKKIKSVLRYHETNLGGSIHSDGPQLSKPPKYLMMACEINKVKGGDTIVADTKRIYEFLKKNKPKYLKILRSKFLFERRGFNFKNKNIFKKPIFFVNNKTFIFRYLRDYIEKGYEIKNKNLSQKFKEALNYLDKLLTSKKFSKKLKLNRGDLILLNNHVLAHGRTAFTINLKSKKPQRNLYRIWLN